MPYWYESFGRQEGSIGSPPFYGPKDYEGPVVIERCGLCDGLGMYLDSVIQQVIACCRCQDTGYWTRPDLPLRDACEECKGEKGGCPGNENVIDGRTLCDYCSAELPNVG